MTTTLAVNYPAPIPVGHRVEITEFADTRPEKKRKGFDMTLPFRHPVVVDLDTGIRYMNHVHAREDGNGGNAFTPNHYPFAPRPGLAVSRVYEARVVACTLVSVEGLSTQHTMLALEPI
ncbi:hypothetical protein FHX82_002917 [Amycolatopsis bartoniae]|uniref:Uncharacterized protein n=1 Tax=Amycolatopsis bartoniae TaxID=941986 RepID=A0A8H9IWP1_9PSEU|nr:hypothetical protein [Amycolatopsis bartoniae]MBB2935863.1 hypothetical protein [Amycolatopsis bartoniae]TVT04998.1 hypothetical protein FNH07_23470 [Amycolatopsis bartoniae]GHF62399.1 hypothetical protein GCM10017566_39910 [Amycolatopsis bartoniae]